MICYTYKVLPEAFERRLTATKSTDSFLDSATSKDISFVCIEDTELFKGITEGKIAVFPRYKRQDMQTVESYFKLGFTCYIMKNYKDYCNFKKSYIEKCINLKDNLEEGKQQVFKVD